MSPTDRSAETRLRRPRPRKAIPFLLYLLSAVFALYVFVVSPGMDAYSRARFGDTLTGRAWRPFVGRVLLPWTVRGTAALTPEPAREAVAGSVRALLTPEGKPEYIHDYAFEFALTVLLLFSSLLGFAYSLRRLAAVTLDLKGRGLDLVPVPALLLLPCMYTYMNYVYDFPNLFLFTLGLVMVVERRWPAFLVVFGLATLNKETSILLTLVWLLDSRGRLSGRRLAEGLAVQILGWAAIRGSITLLYQDNPGAVVEWWHLHGNLALGSRIIANLRHRPLSDIQTKWGPKLVVVLAAVGVAVSLRRTPVFLKRASVIVVPLFVLTLFMGTLEEARQFYEFYPIALLVLTGGMLPASPTRGSSRLTRRAQDS